MQSGVPNVNLPEKETLGRAMTTGRKAGLIVAASLIFLASAIYVGVSRSDRGGWFYGYRCACGSMFIFT
jgi:hypothetical protein